MERISVEQNPSDFFKRVEDSKAEFNPLRQEKQSQGYWAEPNTTQTPNLFFDYFMAGMNEWQLKVTLYLIRHTYGYGKKTGDFVSEGQFINGTESKNKVTGKITRIDWGCGIRISNDEDIKVIKQRLRRTIRQLEALGLVETIRDMKIKVDSKWNTNFYRLKLKASEVVDTTVKQTET